MGAISRARTTFCSAQEHSVYEYMGALNFLRCVMHCGGWVCYGGGTAGVESNVHCGGGRTAGVDELRVGRHYGREICSAP